MASIHALDTLALALRDVAQSADPESEVIEVVVNPALFRTVVAATPKAHLQIPAETNVVVAFGVRIRCRYPTLGANRYPDERSTNFSVPH